MLTLNGSDTAVTGLNCDAPKLGTDGATEEYGYTM